MKLARKIQIILLGTAMFVTGFLGLATYNNSKLILQKFIENNQFELSKRVMLEINRKTYSAYTNIQSLANIEPIEFYLSGRENISRTEIERQMRDLLKTAGPWEDLIVINKKGDIVATTRDSTVCRSINECGQYYLAYQDAIKGEVYSSDLVIPEPKDKPTVIFASPVIDNESSGKPIVGVLIGHFEWNTIFTILNDLDIYHAHLYNQDGIMLASNLGQDNKHILSANYKKLPKPYLDLFGKYGSLIGMSNEGDLNAFISYYSSLGSLSYKGNNWELFLEVPTSTAFAPASNAALLLTLMVGVITLASSFWILVIVSRQAITPILNLTRTVRSIISGDLKTRAEINSDDEIGELALNFNKMTDNLIKSREKERELNKLKDEFLSIASHELRTPMSAIKGLVAMVLDGDYGPVNEGLKSPITDIQLSVNRLIHLVNDMLDISRIEAGRMKLVFSNIPIKDIVLETVSLLKTVAVEKKIKLEVLDLYPGLVQADPDKIKQILSNLIGNSLKFTASGEISVYSKEEVDNIVIYVKDTGIGIESQEQEKLFNKFQQLYSQASGKPEGSGLGLYISKQIAVKMGGDLWLERSEHKKGSLFAFSIPKSGTLQAEKVKKTIEKEALAHQDQK